MKYAVSTEFLALNLTRELDQVLKVALARTDFVIDHCGSEIAAAHKLRAGKASLLLLENRQVASVQATEEVITLARMQSLPFLFITDQKLEDDHLRMMSYYMQVVEPPIYPYRLLSLIKSFQWLENTAYSIRKPREKAKKFHVAFVPANPTLATAAQHFLVRLKAYFEKTGNQFTSYESLDNFNQSENAANGNIIFFYIDDFSTKDINKTLELYNKIQKKVHYGGVVPVFSDQECTAKNTANFLTHNALTVLPDSLGSEDFDQLYESLAFIRKS